MTQPMPDATLAHPGGCPSLGQMAQYLDASESIAENDQDLDRHIQDCTLCQAAIEEMRGRGRGGWINSLISEQKQFAQRKLPVIAGFQLTREISSGGQGIVYYAMEEELKRPVALKFLKHGKFSSDLEIQQFFNEGQAIAALEHPSIIRLYGLKLHDGIPYLIMQWAEHGSLADRLAQSRPTIGQAVEVIGQVTRAIGFAHANGMIHRDLKPSNILMKSADYSDCRISDFGLARKFSDILDEATCTRHLGTPGFMAPEMVSNDFGKPGPRSDVFSIGAILYLLLTGRLAHAGQNPMEIHHLLLNRDPIAPRYFNPQVPRDLQTICLKCLEKEPSRRYQSAEELSSDLELFKSGRPIRARRAGPLGAGLKWCRRNKALAATIGAFWLTTIASSAYIFYLYQKSQTQLDETRDTITYLAPMAKRIFSELSVTDGEKERLERAVDLMMQTGIESRNVETQRNANFAVLELADIIGLWDTTERPLALARFSIQNSHALLVNRENELKRIPDLYDRTELDQSQALNWLANTIQYDHKKVGEAEQLFRQSLTVAGNVVSRRVDPVESLGVLGTIHNNLANCLAGQHKLEEAGRHYRESLKIQAEVLKKNPDNRVRYALLARVSSQYGQFRWRFYQDPKPYLEFWDSRYRFIDLYLKNPNQANWRLIAPELILGYQDLSHIIHYQQHDLVKASSAIERKIVLIERIMQAIEVPNFHLAKALADSKMDQQLIEAVRSPAKPFDRRGLISLLLPTFQAKSNDPLRSSLGQALVLAPSQDIAVYGEAVAFFSRDESIRRDVQDNSNPLDQLIEILTGFVAKQRSWNWFDSQPVWNPEEPIGPEWMAELLKTEKMIASGQVDQAKLLLDVLMKRADHHLLKNLLVIRRLEELTQRFD